MTSPQSVPLLLRLLAGVVLVAFALLVYFLRDMIASQLRAMCGIVAFLALAAICSHDPRRLPWRTIAVGMSLQFALGLLILRVPVVFSAFRAISDVITLFLDFANSGAEFVFGPIAQGKLVGGVFGPTQGFIFATMAMPAIIFVSSFFAVLYYLGVLQIIVRSMAWVMHKTMGVSGPESLSAAANVFMGQTEAPLIVKPYVQRMSKSQLLALMIGGMATVSGGMMAVFIKMGADPVSLLTTSVMAAPAGLYLAKILYPEEDADASEKMLTPPADSPDEPRPVNVIDAASRGASDGLFLVLNVIAMLIAFIAFIRMFNSILGLMGTSLEAILSVVFAPMAALIGVDGADVPTVGKLLGIKLVGNELLAFVAMTTQHLPGQAAPMDPRSILLTTFALTGFANFASIGIQLGGIGAIAKNQRPYLAQLGGRALLGGFLATMINACVAAIVL